MADPNVARGEKWWREAPIETHILDGMIYLSPRLAKFQSRIDSWSAVRIAEAVEHGLIDGWPWELTKKGRRALR